MSENTHYVSLWELSGRSPVLAGSCTMVGIEAAVADPID
jgi:hypothetical protein